MVKRINKPIDPNSSQSSESLLKQPKLGHELTIFYQSLEGGNNRNAVSNYANTFVDDASVPSTNVTSAQKSNSQIKEQTPAQYQAIIAQFINKHLESEPDIFILAEYDLGPGYRVPTQWDSTQYRAFSMQGANQDNKADERRSMTIFVKNDPGYITVTKLDPYKDFGFTEMQRGSQKLYAMILAWLLMKSQCCKYEDALSAVYYKPMQQLEEKYKAIAQLLGQCFRIKYRGRSIVVAHTINNNVKSMIKELKNELLQFYDVILGDLNLRRGEAKKLKELELSKDPHVGILREHLLNTKDAENDGVIFSTDLVNCIIKSERPTINEWWLADHHMLKLNLTFKAPELSQKILKARSERLDSIFADVFKYDKGSIDGATTYKINVTFQEMMRATNMTQSLKSLSNEDYAKECLAFLKDNAPQAINTLDEGHKSNCWIFRGTPRHELNKLSIDKLKAFFEKFTVTPT